VTETASSGSSGGSTVQWLAAGSGSSSKQNAIADTCFLWCFSPQAECLLHVAYNAVLKGPSLQNSGRNSGFRRIPEQINLALE